MSRYVVQDIKTAVSELLDLGDDPKAYNSLIVVGLLVLITEIAAVVLAI